MWLNFAPRGFVIFRYVEFSDQCARIVGRVAPYCRQCVGVVRKFLLRFFNGGEQRNEQGMAGFGYLAARLGGDRT